MDPRDQIDQLVARTAPHLQENKREVLESILAQPGGQRSINAMWAREIGQAQRQSPPPALVPPIDIGLAGLQASLQGQPGGFAGGATRRQAEIAAPGAAWARGAAETAGRAAGGAGRFLFGPAQLGARTIPELEPGAGAPPPVGLPSEPAGPTVSPLYPGGAYNIVNDPTTGMWNIVDQSGKPVGIPTGKYDTADGIEITTPASYPTVEQAQAAFNRLTREPGGSGAFQPSGSFLGDLQSIYSEVQAGNMDSQFAAVLLREMGDYYQRQEPKAGAAGPQWRPGEREMAERGMTLEEQRLAQQGETSRLADEQAREQERIDLKKLQAELYRADTANMVQLGPGQTSYSIRGRQLKSTRLMPAPPSFESLRAARV